MKIISKFVSPFTFKVVFSITELPSNNSFQLWTFYPDGEAIQGIDFSSDDNGNAINSQGINEIVSGHSSSNILPNGQYIFGINNGIFQFRLKPYFNDWEKSSNSKYQTRIDLSYEKETILTLNEIGNIPWGTDATVNGHLWFKNVDIEREPLVWPNGAGWFIGQKIYFTGSNTYPEPITTDGLSKFLSQFQIDENPELRCTLQAHYDGDSKYFDKCDSNIIYYDIIRHRTTLVMKLDNLKLKLFDNYADENNIKMTLETNQYFRLKGNLIDTHSNTKCENKTITFETSLSGSIPSTATEKNGSFQIDNLKAPSITGIYYIKSLFDGDNLYEKSESNIIEFNVIEKNEIHQDAILDENRGYDNTRTMSINPSIFHNRNFRINNNLCFVLMPFKPRFDDIYNKYMKPVLQRRFKQVKRADEIFKSTSIMEDIWTLINEARLIVADVTTRNPNVFYELGIANCIGKEFIILTQDEKDIPFDLNHIRHLKYVDNEDEWKNFEERLRKFIDNLS